MGFVAQEVQDVMKQYGMEGSYNLVKIMEKNYLGLNTTEIIPILVNAVQEQNKTIEELKKENEALKKQVVKFSQLEEENGQLQSRVEQLQREFEEIMQTVQKIKEGNGNTVLSSVK